MNTTHQRADIILNDMLRETSTPHIWLHLGDPGVNGTANVAKVGTSTDIARKSITFAAPANHGTENKRQCLSSNLIEWTGVQIDASQTITHFSIWTALTVGTPDVISAVAVSKITGSDGVTITAGDIVVAMNVHAKPA